MELRVFESEEFGKVRTEEIDGKVWFCGVDVARALGYAKPKNAIKEHCRGTLKQGDAWDGGPKTGPHPQQQNGKVTEGCIICTITDDLAELNKLNLLMKVTSIVLS